MSVNQIFKDDISQYSVSDDSLGAEEAAVKCSSLASDQSSCKTSLLQVANLQAIFEIRNDIGLAPNLHYRINGEYDNNRERWVDSDENDINFPEVCCP